MARIHNFSAGPGVLPEPVIDVLRRDLYEYQDTGVGIVECSHRSKPFDAVLQSAKANISKLLMLDEDQKVLFLHGGARTQFYQWPMNILQGRRASYLDTGAWSKYAATEADRYGTADRLFSSADTKYDRVPAKGGWAAIPEGTVYLHYTSNNTIAGTEYHYVPTVPEGVLLACDMSSNFLSRPIDGSQFDFIYAGAQKNVGPSGCCVVIVREGLLDQMNKDIPAMLQYGSQVTKDSMLNTPCTFAIHAINEVTKWLIGQGGVQGIEVRNIAQADKLYGAIDRSAFWSGKVQKASRSRMNVTFTTGDDVLDTMFWQTAATQGLSALKGHRSVGGLRASLYNAQTDAAVDALVAFMAEFERTKG